MSKRRRSGSSRRAADDRFWAGGVDSAGAAAQGASAPRAIRPTPDPSGLVRSLGPAPLVLDPTVVERHFQAVYEEAVRAATALAHANGLLSEEEE